MKVSMNSWFLIGLALIAWASGGRPFAQVKRGAAAPQLQTTQTQASLHRGEDRGSTADVGSVPVRGARGRLLLSVGGLLHEAARRCAQVLGLGSAPDQVPPATETTLWGTSRQPPEPDTGSQE
jgi:hypothetical protein